jgi:hypothetical protein
MFHFVKTSMVKNAVLSQERTTAPVSECLKAKLIHHEPKTTVRATFGKVPQARRFALFVPLTARRSLEVSYSRTLPSH